MNGKYSIGDYVLENWRLTELIGEGSYGRVYKAVREEFGNVYTSAVKIVTIPQSQSEVKSALSEGSSTRDVSAYFSSMVKEIVQEVALMSRLKGSANIVSYEDHAVVPHIGQIGWDIIVRMELLTPLLDYIYQDPLSNDEVIKLGIDICRALELCEKNRIIHRDVKPENIFVSAMGDFKLGDFGIARTLEKTTGALSKKGTYVYMAPEVYLEKPYNSSVDIYSLGIVMYRFLNNNRAPFLPSFPNQIRFEDRERALSERMHGVPIPPPCDADEALSKIVMKACAYSSRDRYAGAEEMRYALETLGDKGGILPVIHPIRPEKLPEANEIYRCPECGRRVKKKNTLCSECRKWRKQKKTINTVFLWFIAGVFIISILVIISSLRNRNSTPKDNPDKTKPPVETMTPAPTQHVHKYIWETTRSASCTENGLKTGKCQCGEMTTEEIPAGHKLKNGVCSECGYISPDHIHAYDWTEKKPGCTTTGERTGVCACGETKSETLNAIGHDWVRTGVDDADCTEEGCVYATCSRCGAKNERILPALGHDYVGGVCSRCGAKDDNSQENIFVFEGEVISTENLDKLPFS